jgi:hypothetical protein
MAGLTMDSDEQGLGYPLGVTMGSLRWPRAVLGWLFPGRAMGCVGHGLFWS